MNIKKLIYNYFYLWPLTLFFRMVHPSRSNLAVSPCLSHNPSEIKKRTGCKKILKLNLIFATISILSHIPLIGVNRSENEKYFFSIIIMI